MEWKKILLFPVWPAEEQTTSRLLTTNFDYVTVGYQSRNTSRLTMSLVCGVCSTDNAPRWCQISRKLTYTIYTDIKELTLLVLWGPVSWHHMYTPRCCELCKTELNGVIWHGNKKLLNYKIISLRRFYQIVYHSNNKAVCMFDRWFKHAYQV